MMILIGIFLLGMIFGSFLNVCIYRMPREKSIAFPASHCPSCEKPIKWYHNVPVFGFLILGGKCANCKKGISFLYPLVEILGGVAALSAYLIWGFTPYALMAAIIFWALIVMSFIDLEHQIIPHEISLGGIVVGLVFSLFFPEWHGVVTMKSGIISAGLGVLIGGGSLLLLTIVSEFFLKKEAMGGGDIKFLAAAGAFIGWTGAFLTLFIAAILGSVIGIFQRIVYKEERIPFGPYLAIGFVVSLVYGRQLANWYMSHFLGIS